MIKRGEKAEREIKREVYMKERVHEREEKERISRRCKLERERTCFLGSQPLNKWR